MSKKLREAIRAELLALDDVADSEPPTARIVLERLWAHATAEFLVERQETAQLLAEAIAGSQSASLVAPSTSHRATGLHLTPESILEVIVRTDVL